MIYATVNYRIIPYLNALCHSLASYGASTFLVRRLSTRNQSKSDSFLSLLSVTPVNCFPTILDSNDACPVASHYRPSRNFPSPFSPFSTVSKSNRILERSAILSEWKLDATPTFSGDGATTRSERNGREFGVEASLHFYETPPPPIRAYITVVVLSTRRVRVRVLFTAFRSFTRAIPATTIYTKSVFHLFHATDVASPPSARESSRTREMSAI